MPSTLAWLDDDGHVMITARGISQAEPKHPVLGGLCPALDHALLKFQEDDWSAKPTLTEEELVSRRSLTSQQARWTFVVLTAESLITPSSRAGEAVISSDIRHFRAVETLRDYIETRTDLDKRRRWQGIGRNLRARLSSLLPAAAARTILYSVLAILIASFILWIGRQIAPSPPNDQPPTSTKAQTSQPNRNPGVSPP